MRWQDALFLAYYLAYTKYLVIAATSNRTLPLFSSTMLVFATPLTLATLGLCGPG